MRRALPVLVVMTMVACAPAARASRPSAPATERTVHVTAAQFGSQISVGVGDVLVVARPADYDEWDVAFSTDVLRSLNTERGRRPPANGWTFAVIARGTTDVSFTPAVSRGGALNVQRFVITVTVE